MTREQVAAAQSDLRALRDRICGHTLRIKYRKRDITRVRKKLYADVDTMIGLLWDEIDD